MLVHGGGGGRGAGRLGVLRRWLLYTVTIMGSFHCIIYNIIILICMQPPQLSHFDCVKYAALVPS